MPEAGAAPGGVLLEACLGDRFRRLVTPRIDGLALDIDPAQRERRRR